MFVYVIHARIRSWNQPVLSNEGKVSCSRKQQGPLLGLELTTDRHPLRVRRGTHCDTPPKYVLKLDTCLFHHHGNITDSDYVTSQIRNLRLVLLLLGNVSLVWLIVKYVKMYMCLILEQSFLHIIDFACIVQKLGKKSFLYLYFN